MAGVFHAGPWLLRGQGVTLLQQFDGNIVGRADKGHAPVARRAVDGHAVVLQVLAGLINVLDRIGEVAEMAAVAGQRVVAVPIVGQLNIGVTVVHARGAEENQRETAPFVVDPAPLDQPQKLVKCDGDVEIFHAHHGVQVFDGHRFSFGWLA